MGEDSPRLFGNHVISQLVGHMMGEDMLVESQDLLSLRTAFRSSGGSWLALGDGDITQMDLLKKLIGAWGKMPGRRKTWII